MEKDGSWQPTPIPVPELPQTPPPEYDPKHRRPELGEQSDKDETPRGSIIIGGDEPNEDNRGLIIKMKPDDEM